MKKTIKSAIAQEQSFFMVMPALLWQVLFLYVPIAVIVGMSFVHAVDAAFWRNFTLENYATIVNISYLKVIFRSCVLALSNAFLCLAVAYPVAYFLAMQVNVWKNTLLLLLILPFWTNVLVQVYAWFFVLEKYGLINRILIKIGLITTPLHFMSTPWAIHVVMLFCYLPFMIMPIYTALEKINKRLLEASYDLGADQWYTFRHITWPLSLSGVKTGFLLVFIPSFGEFVIPSLMGGGKTLYVGSLITQYFIETRNLFLGSAFTVVSALVLIIMTSCVHLLFKQSAGIGGKDGN